MPRVENMGKNVDHWYEHEADGDGSSTEDVCKDCYEQLEADPQAFEELTPYNGDPQGDIGWGGEVSHPPYDETEYECAVCGAELNEDDD